MNANLTRIVALEHSADLRRGARDVRAGRVNEEPAPQPQRARRLVRWLQVRRTRLSGRLATSPDSCDA